MTTTTAHAPAWLDRLSEWLEPASLEEANFFKGLEQIKTGELDALVRVTAMPMSDFNEKFDPKYHEVIPIALEELERLSKQPGGP